MTKHTNTVVSYRNSTSNHNYPLRLVRRWQVVSYRNSTSNHNIESGKAINILLYLIEILHQTTTGHGQGFHRIMLYLIEILHQTTTCLVVVFDKSELYLIEILHQTTTPANSPSSA